MSRESVLSLLKSGASQGYCVTATGACPQVVSHHSRSSTHSRPVGRHSKHPLRNAALAAPFREAAEELYYLEMADEIWLDSAENCDEWEPFE